VFKRLKHIAPLTKILIVAIILILLPDTISSYLSLQSISRKAENLRTQNYIFISGLSIFSGTNQFAWIYQFSVGQINAQGAKKTVSKEMKTAFLAF